MLNWFNLKRKEDFCCIYGLNKKLSWKYIYFAFLSKNQHVNIYHNKEIVVYLIPKI